MKKSARRQAFAARKIQKEKKNRFHLFRILIPIATLILLYVFLRLSANTWNGTDKVSFVYNDADGDIGVIVLDPRLSEATTLIIPGDTQVEVARNYGTLRIKNVWQLGINEKVEGRLLAETVTQNFLFPVYLWDEKVPSFDQWGLLNALRFIFLPGQTNISFGDRVYMGFFALKVSEMGRSVIDLGKSQFLQKEILNDGLPGYEISGPISQRLTVYFSDNKIGDENLKVNIVDATGAFGVSDKLGEILQIIGGKVVSVDKKTISENTDCTVSGVNTEAVEKIAKLFSCKKQNTDTSFDLDIRVGEEFAKRF